MSSQSSIDPNLFIQKVQPLLERKDLAGLLHLLKSTWTPQQIQDLLSSRHLDAKKVALLAIGLVGSACCLEALAKHLRDPDQVVNEMAEHALWSIWFRMGANPEANHQLARGAQALERRDFQHAITHFDEALQLDPAFPEPYNQRAIAKYLMERYEESIEDCRQAVKRMPFHFGALAGMGHCWAYLGDVRQAIECYEKALHVNPHLDCVQKMVGELKQRL